MGGTLGSERRILCNVCLKKQATTEARGARGTTGLCEDSHLAKAVTFNRGLSLGQLHRERAEGINTMASFFPSSDPLLGSPLAGSNQTQKARMVVNISLQVSHLEQRSG